MARISHHKAARSSVGKEVRDDNALLLQVSRHRSRPAFTKLIERYHNRAFNLACRITGDQDSALDALQEALCRIWRSADTYKEQGEVRAWIMKIVAHTAIVQLKKKKRNSHFAPIEAIETQNGILNIANKDLESKEALTVLHRLLGTLPQADQRLISLYYSGGMNQEEIGSTLGMAQTTVSSRLKSIIKKLKGGLRQAGLTTGMASILEPQTFRNLLESGFGNSNLNGPQLLEVAFSEAPPGLQHVVAPRWNIQKAGLMLLPLLIAFGWAGLTFIKKKDTNVNNIGQAKETTHPLPTTKLSSAWKIAPKTGPFHYEWDFTNRQLNGAKLAAGYMRWIRAEGEKTRGLEPIGDGARLLLPVMVTHRDFVVEVYYQSNAKALTLGLLTGAPETKSSRTAKTFKSFVSVKPFNITSWFFHKQLSYCSTNGKMTCVTRYDGVRGAGLAFNLRKLMVSKIIVRSVRTDEQETEAMRSMATQIPKKKPTYKFYTLPIPPLYEATPN